MSTAGTPARQVGMTVQVGGRAIQLPPWQAMAAPVFIVMMLAMMILPLPALLLDLLFTFNIARGSGGAAGLGLHGQAARVRGVPERAAGDDAAAAVAERRLDPRGAAARSHRHRRRRAR
jgi:hypothetical protein